MITIYFQVKPIQEGKGKFVSVFTEISRWVLKITQTS